MATAPKVQKLSQVMADLNPAYDGQRKVLGQQQQQLRDEGAATITGLKAQRGEAWNDIGSSANARGLAFSGIPSHEQARYDSTHFMPAVAQTEQGIIKGVSNLQMAGAQLDTDARKTALGRIDQQQSSLNQWNLSQMQLEAQARENALNRQAQAAEGAANRAADAAGRVSEQPSQNAQVRSYLDQYVDPETGKVPVGIWKNAVRRASEGGMKFSGSDGFASTFWNYADDSDWESYRDGYDKWN